jgi:hypothetical protein
MLHVHHREGRLKSPRSFALKKMVKIARILLHAEFRAGPSSNRNLSLFHSEFLLGWMRSPSICPVFLTYTSPRPPSACISIQSPFASFTQVFGGNLPTLPFSPRSGCAKAVIQPTSDTPPDLYESGRRMETHGHLSFEYLSQGEHECK